MYDYEHYIQTRIGDLRKRKGVSASEMSLALGQNDSYINKIELKKAMPSISGLLYICEYFKITPGEFFDESSPYPEILAGLIEDLKLMDESALAHIAGVAGVMVGKKKS